MRKNNTFTKLSKVLASNQSIQYNTRLRPLPSCNTRSPSQNTNQDKSKAPILIVLIEDKSVQNTVNKYGILAEDIYNFDETGFQMGQISPSMVVTASDRQGRPKQIKPTNTAWVTLIQGVCADGTASPPPFIIFQGKEFNLSWFEGLPPTWSFALSPNGWTSNEIGLQWLQHYEKHTRSKTIGSKRLLILDNHGSHTTPEFRAFCEDKDIIPLWMPPHSSHLLQPLDVGCFGPLKQAYSKQN